jgi:hypothetical protein
MNTKNRVIVVHANINKVINMNAAFLLCTMKAIAAPAEHIINTL